MKSIYASELTSQAIWHDFIAHFKSDTTKASYETDINEIMEFTKRDFLNIGAKEAGEYFTFLTHKVEQGSLRPGTLAKKFRELHSFAQYISENKERYGVDERYEDVYYPYLKLVAKQEAYARYVPVEHIDRIFQAAWEEPMGYCILVFLYRAGLSSTEIAELTPGDFGRYDDGVYAVVKDRREPCFIPEDAVEVLENYMRLRENRQSLFYNKRGNKLNTMYISRLMKKYTSRAGVPAYSAESIRNTCGFTLFAYGAKEKQTAEQLGITESQVKRYKYKVYKRNLQREANRLVKIKVMPPEEKQEVW